MQVIYYIKKVRFVPLIKKISNDLNNPLTTSSTNYQLVSVEQALLTTQDESERAELLTLKDSLIELIALTQYSEEENKEEIDKEMQNFMREIKEIDQEDELHKVKVHNFGFSS